MFACKKNEANDKRKQIVQRGCGAPTNIEHSNRISPRVFKRKAFSGTQLISFQYLASYVQAGKSEHMDAEATCTVQKGACMQERGRVQHAHTNCLVYKIYTTMAKDWN